MFLLRVFSDLYNPPSSSSWSRCAASLFVSPFFSVAFKPAHLVPDVSGRQMRLTHKQQWACAEWVFSIKTTKQQWLSRWWVCGDSLNSVTDINNTINIIHPTMQVFWVHAHNDGELWDKPFKGRKKGKLLQLFGMSGGSDMPTDYHQGARKKLPRITEKQESLERRQEEIKHNIWLGCHFTVDPKLHQNL